MKIDESWREFQIFQSSRLAVDSQLYDIEL